MSKKEKKYLIYSYIVNNAVYVGLTKNIEYRHKRHMKGGEKDSLYVYCSNNSTTIPEPCILERGLTGSEAQVKENDWITYYKDKQFEIINRAKCGYQISSLGGGSKNNTKTYTPIKSKKIISYEDCYNIAKECNSKKDFKIKNINLYNHAHKQGWTKDYTWFEFPKVSLVSEKITIPLYEEKAKECKSLTEFCLKYRKYYMWGLKNGMNKKYFKKSLKMNNYIYEEYSGMTIESVIDEFKKYESKTDLYKKNRKLYNHSRLCGWLKYFPKKEKKKYNDYVKVEKYDMCDIDISKLILIPTFKNYYIDIENCIIYKALKKRINKVNPIIKKNGLICYSLIKINGDNKTYPYHKFLRLSLGINDCNCVKYIDGDYSNIKRDNLSFYKHEINNCRQVHTYYNDIINNKGEIYNIVDEIVINGDKVENGRWRFGTYFVDELVYDFFINKIEYGKTNIEHINGDLLDNNFQNLYVENNKNGKIEVIENENTNTISIIDLYGKRFLLGNISDKYVLRKVVNSLNEMIKTYRFVDDWFFEYKESTYTNFVNDDIKANIEKLRSESCGCYWHAPRKCWKSKLFFNNKEYTLGYFSTFEEGKFIYDVACTYIKYDKFEWWYNDIKNYRKYVKELFKGE